MIPKRTVFVCVTAQLSCEQLIASGRMIADEENASLRIITVYPTKQSYDPDIDTLVSLNECSLKYNAEMTVFFSDNPVEKICESVSEYKDAVVVTGFPGKHSTEFIASLHKRIPKTPVCMVDNDGTIYRLERKSTKCVNSLNKQN